MNNSAVYKLICMLCLCKFNVCAQIKSGEGSFSKLFNNLHYDITLYPNPFTQAIVGSNKITFNVLNTFKHIDIDLFNNLTVDSVVSINNVKLSFDRSHKSIKIFTQDISKMQYGFTIYYSGKPKVAKNAPWDGGFVWQKDKNNNDWISLACEGLGASCWLPCFDRWDVEPTAEIALITNKNYTGVSNGKLILVKNINDSLTLFKWFVNSPINVYNISVNIGKFTNFTDTYVNEQGNTLNLNYYVLAYNQSKAKTHFQQVKRMLQCFEKNAGPYPFYADDYKLVETPYWGMEHQSCVAYGNNYEFNEFGFDFIIIHESAHEWFGNSLTAKNKTHFWIHEGFTTYMETIYTECLYGKQRANEYILKQKKLIKNKYPVINREIKDNDVYYKGAWILHTLRNMVNNDELWRKTFLDFATTYRHSTLTSEDVISFFSNKLNLNLNAFFDEYLNYVNIPTLQYVLVSKNGVTELHYRLLCNNSKLKMMLKVKISKRGYDFIEATSKWQIIDLPYDNFNAFEVSEDFLVNSVKLNNR